MILKKDSLLRFLRKYEDLFDGMLGEVKTTPVHFELKEGAKPFHGRSFPVPCIHREAMKKEINRMVKLGIIKWKASQNGPFQHLQFKKQARRCILYRILGN